MSTGLQGVKDEQEYIVVRERVHRDTAESTVSRPLSFLLYKRFSGSGQDERRMIGLMLNMFRSLLRAERPREMVVHRSIDLVGGHLRVERVLSEELVRGQEGLVNRRRRRE